MLYRGGLRRDYILHERDLLLLLLRHIKWLLELLLGLTLLKLQLGLLEVGGLLLHPAVQGGLQLPFHGLLPSRLFNFGAVFGGEINLLAFEVVEGLEVEVLCPELVAGGHQQAVRAVVAAV